MRTYFLYDKKMIQEKIKENKKMLKQNSQVRRASGDEKHPVQKIPPAHRLFKLNSERAARYDRENNQPNNLKN